MRGVGTIWTSARPFAISGPWSIIRRRGGVTCKNDISLLFNGPTRLLFVADSAHYLSEGWFTSKNDISPDGSYPPPRSQPKLNRSVALAAIALGIARVSRCPLPKAGMRPTKFDSSHRSEVRNRRFPSFPSVCRPRMNLVTGGGKEFGTVHLLIFFFAKKLV